MAQGLTNQIIAELNAMGYSFSSMDTQWVRCTSPCVNQLQSAAATSLVAAAIKKGEHITLTSALRSSAQQYLLWNQQSSCPSILGANRPGTSNHEGGRAIDTKYYTYWLPTLQSNGWTQSYPITDAVHFDYTAAPDIRRENLRAFQRLHNRHTGSSIAEDGLWGPNTQTAMYNAPCNGW